MSEKVEARYVGHCGKIFRDFEVCDEPKIDDLCQFCPYNDDDLDEPEEEE